MALSQLQADILLSVGLDVKSLDRSIAELTATLKDGVQKNLGKLDLGGVKEGDNLFKSFAFNIGLVGYAMENLGGRLLNFATNIYQFIDASAKVTENLERMRNSLIIEGVGPEDRRSIEGQLRRIANLPNANIDSITKGFVELHKAGLDTAQTLQLLEGVALGTASAGSGKVGLVHSLNILRDTLSNKEFARGLRSLQGALGPEIEARLKKDFGASDQETLNKAGVKNVIAVISDELSKLQGTIPITLDRITRIDNAFVVLRANIERLLAPSLDKLLEKFDALSEFSTNLADKFEKLPQSQKDFISGLLTAIPAIVAASGVVLSFAGVLAVATATFARLGTVWKGLAGFGTEIKAFFGPLGLTLKLFTTGTISLSKAIGILVGELGGVGLGLLKILGLTTPLGLLLNVILAYITNAGRARDLINGALGSIYVSVTKLFDKLSEFFGSGGTGESIIRILTTFANLLGGILGDIVATALQSISKVIDALTDLLNFFRHPSIGSFEQFGRTLFEAMTGAVVNLAKLFAASFLDALAELGPQKDNPNAVPLTGGLGAYLSQTYDLHAIADKLRKSTGIISDNTGDTANNLEKTKKEALDFQVSLENSNKVINEMSLSLERARASFAKVFADIELANIKFRNAQSQRESQERLDLLIKQVGTQAIPEIRANEKTLTTQGLDEIRRAVRSELPALAEALRTAGLELDDAFKTVDQITFTDPDKVSQFRFLIGELIQLSKSPNVNLNSFGAAFEKAANAFVVARDTMLGHGDDGQKQLKGIQDAYSKILQSSTAVNGKLGEQVEKENQLRNVNEQKRKDEEKAARAQQRRADSEVAARAAQVELARLEADYQKSQLSPITTAAEIQAATAREEAYNKRKLELEKTINTAKNENVDLVEKEKNTTKEATDAVTSRVKAEVSAMEVRTQANEAFINSFVQGFGALDEFRDKLDKINEIRASLGLNPTAPLAGIDSANAIGGLLNNQTIPLTNRNRVLGGDKDTASQLERMVESLARGVPLSKAFADSLQRIGIGSVQGLSALQADITSNQASITRQRGVLAGLAPGADRSAAETTLNDLLKIQTKLGTQAEVYANNLQIVNSILTANDKLLANSVVHFTRINAAEKANIESELRLLELQGELLKAREDIRQAQATGLEGLDVATAQRLAQEALDNEVAALEAKYKLELNLLAVKERQAEEEVKNGHLTREEADALIETYKKQKSVLTDITAAQKEALKASKDRKVFEDFKTSLENLSSIKLTKVADDFTALIGHIKNQTGKGVTYLTAFKDLAVAAVTAFGDSLSQAIVDSIVSGESFLKSLGHFFGQLLIQLGSTLISLGTAALALAALAVFFPGIVPPQYAIGTPAALTAIAVGTGLVAAGALIGGGNKTNTAAKTNATNSANTAAGATGPEFDPYKDPKTIYQKALMAKILIDIKTDDTQVIKTVIKEVNGNGRLSTLISNRKLQFGY